MVSYLYRVRVLMFGSRARGEAAADSDTDLLVILDDDAPAHHATLHAGWESLCGYDEPADVVTVRRSAGECRSKVVGVFAYEVSQDGVSVYEPD